MRAFFSKKPAGLLSRQAPDKFRIKKINKWNLPHTLDFLIKAAPTTFG